MSTCRYLQVLRGTHECYYSTSSISSSSVCSAVPALLLPFRCLLFSLNVASSSLRGISPDMSHQDANTVATRVDSSLKECRILDTVNPPHENARSTSVEDAEVSETTV